ncbi:thiopurine S-methyltransferase [Hyphomicrobiales bacterium 4NK60-0047b]
MDENFWHERWNNNEIPFHESEANKNLVNNLDKLQIKEKSRIFIPLCGKTLDIGWLLSRRYKVVGAELSEFAINELFKQLEVKPIIKDTGSLKCYSAPNIDIFVGNIFELTIEDIGLVDAIYDRGAYVALPKEIRSKYSQHMKDITKNAPQLLIAYEYNQNLMKGPPFSIPPKELENNYNDAYEITNLNSKDVEGGLKGICAAKENVWLLQP